MRRDRDPSFQQTLDLIYDAAVDPTLWRTVVEQVMAYCGASGSITFLVDLKEAIPLLAVYSGQPAEMPEQYFAHYMRCDPGISRGLAMPPGTFINARLWMGDRALENTEFYNDFMRRFDVCDTGGVMLFKDEKHLATLCLQRSPAMGLHDADSMRKLEALAPHLRRAFRISQRFQRFDEQVRSLSEALGCLAEGVILLDGAGQVVFVNRQADQYMNRRGTLEVRKGRLAARDLAEDATLQGIVHRATQTGRGNGADAGGAIALHESDGRRRLLMAVSPARTAHVGVTFAAQPVRAIVFVRDAQAPAPLSPEALRIWFGLTGAEARLAQALAQGESPSEVADRLGLSKDTIRNQLQAIYGKTGVRRQAELVRLLLVSPTARASGSETH